MYFTKQLGLRPAFYAGLAPAGAKVSARRSVGRGYTGRGRGADLGWRKLSWALMLAWSGMAQSAPSGGVVSAGQASWGGCRGS